MFDTFKSDLAAALKNDPAARNKFEIWLTYSGFHAIRRYRVAHWFYLKGMPLTARIISQLARKKTGVEIHPAAKIGKGVFIDHGAGVVIGETAEVGDNVTIYQNVTLGGTGKDVGKRHPTVKNGVMLSAGCSVLGPVTVGEGAKIGAGSVVLCDVPPYCTVVGIPGRVVRQYGKKADELDQRLPDPLLEELMRLNKRISSLEDKLGVQACKYSITTDELNSGSNPVKEKSDA